MIFKYLTLFCVLMIAQSTFAQDMLRNRRFGELIMRSPVQEVYVDIKGDPFLFPNWSKASITTDFTTTDNLNVLYNEIDDQLIFKVKKSDIRKVILPIKEFKITNIDNKDIDRKFKSGFSLTKFSNEKTFFEVLVNGKITLLKKNSKYISYNREYSGAIARVVKNDPNYYLVFEDNVPLKLKQNEKLLLNKFRDKMSGIDKYFELNNINVKSQDDLIKLVNYYNTL